MMQRSAVLSESRDYRYRLERTWDERRDWVLWMMLNPPPPMRPLMTSPSSAASDSRTTGGSAD